MLCLVKLNVVARVSGYLLLCALSDSDLKFADSGYDDDDDDDSCCDVCLTKR